MILGRNNLGLEVVSKPRASGDDPVVRLILARARG